MKLLRIAALTLSCLSFFQTAYGADLTPDEALAKLQEGNKRYVSGHSIHARIDSERRMQTALQGQRPIAAILGCADSRVPPELVLDTAFAELFVVRVAGNICDPAEAGSIEYAVKYLNTPLVVVLGHAQCGAVQAAVQNKQVTPNVAHIVEKIQSSVKEALLTGATPTEVLRISIQHNVWNSIADLLKQSAVIRDAVGSGKVKIVGAIRDLRSGHIDWLGTYPLQDELLHPGTVATPAAAPAEPSIKATEVTPLNKPANISP